MPVTRIRRGRNSGSKLTGDQTQHLAQGWALDGCIPYFGTPGFPFKDEAQRRKRWEEHRGELVKRWGPVERMAAWRDYDATKKQREAFDAVKMPNVWGWRSAHGDDGAGPVRNRVAEVVHLPVDEDAE